MKIGKKSFILISGLALFFLAGFIFLKIGKKDSEYLTGKVSRETITQTVSSTGVLVSESKIKLNFEVSGRIKTINAKVGEKTVKGEILAVLEDNIFSREAEKARLALEKATATAGANEDEIREAEQAVENAERYLEKVEDLEDQKVDAAEEAYNNAADYYDDALDYYNKVKDENGADSAEAKSAKLTLTTALNSKKSAEEAKETAEETQDLNVLSAENSLDTYEEKLKTAKSIYARQSRDATVESSRADYQIALANLEKTVLKAPVSGEIAGINYKESEILGNSLSGDAFGEIISEDFILESNMPESDIAKLKKGQKAEVTFDALTSEEIFQAELVEIEPAATVIQDVVYYKTKFRLDFIDPRLKEGMSADVDIQTEKKENVLAVPGRVINEGKLKILLDNGKIKQVEVKTGIRGDDGQVEIISGLSGGEEIILTEKED